jgi:anti-anti-sigma factor
MGKILFADQDGVQVLKFEGDVRVCLGPTISSFLNCIDKNRGINAVVIDLRETTGIDSTSLGLLAKISIRSQDKLKVLPTIVSTNEDITRVLLSMGFDKIFVVDSKTPRCCAELSCEQMGELPAEVVSEAALRQQVLEAHRTLMQLNDNNLVAFKDLVAALEQEQETSRVPPRLRANG